MNSALRKQSSQLPSADKQQSLLSLPKRLFIVTDVAAGFGGGSESLWIQIAESLIERGHTVVVGLNERSEKSFLPSLRAKKVRIFDSPMSFPARFARKAFHYDYFYDVLRRSRPEHVLVNCGSCYSNHDWMRAARELKIPYTVLLHSSTKNLWPSDVAADLFRKLYGDASALLVTGFNTQKNICSQLATTFPQFRWIANPNNIPKGAPYDWPKDNAVLKLASVARLQCWTKGQDILLSVLSLPKWRQRPISLTLVGDGENRDFILRSVRLLKLEETVKMVGLQTDLSAIWSTHHALVLPSRVESMAMAVVEAAACGRPVVATDIGDITRYIKDGESGFIAPYPTVDAFDSALERLWNHRTELERMGTRARSAFSDYLKHDPQQDLLSILSEVHEQSLK